MGIKVLSLFDGISCGQIALERADIKVDSYFASEIDKYSIEVTQKNYPNTIQLGDICEIKSEGLPKIDLLIGGSPCQGFSLAGKQLNFDDKRSKLFFEFVRLLRWLKPKYFLLENVNMRKEWQDIITKYIGVEPVKINSGDVSAQNRTRLYWTNIPIKEIDKNNIILKDILEENIEDKFFIKGDVIYDTPCFDLNKNNICNPIKDKSNKGWHFEQNVYTEDSKTRSLKAGGGSGNIPKILINGIIRKLTPLECERLQTLPNNYTANVSNSRRYMGIGNGWTVDVIAHIFKELKNTTAFD